MDKIKGGAGGRMLRDVRFVFPAACYLRQFLLCLCSRPVQFAAGSWGLNLTLLLLHSQKVQQRLRSPMSSHDSSESHTLNVWSPPYVSLNSSAGASVEYHSRKRKQFTYNDQEFFNMLSLLCSSISLWKSLTAVKLLMLKGTVRYFNRLVQRKSYQCARVELD